MTSYDCWLCGRGLSDDEVDADEGECFRCMDGFDVDGFDDDDE